MKINWKRLPYDIFIDVLGGILAAIGVYNFAANAGFPMSGVSGIALIFYKLFGLPLGATIIVLNVPIALLCYKSLGKEFFLRSIRTVIITSLIMDYVAPLLPVYNGDRMLAAICTGIFAGLGYALIFSNNTSTGGTDFISMAIRARNPHVTLGRIIFVLDAAIVLLGGAVFKDLDATIYGFIISYLLSLIVDKLMYGIDAGKMTLIVTDHGQDVADVIAKYSDRGSTIMHGKGGFSGNEREIVMCACNNKQMSAIRRAVKQVDPNAFTVIMESSEVLGEGFKEE